ncbi:hypothetical protein [uncultured Enterovirga sp.]|uniref:hypothetical protein n=1 Tax=uncultured Enterovirga sp. TaxID=2026352 RepID=UPI0035CC4958
MFSPATNGGDIADQLAVPTREAADKLVDDRLAAPFTADANDFIYAWESSGAYDPTPGLAKITAPLLAINAADDKRNPPITGLTEQAIGRIKGARLLLIPAGPESRGHGSGGLAKLYARELGAWLAGVPGGLGNRRLTSRTLLKPTKDVLVFGVQLADLPAESINNDHRSVTPRRI